MKATRVSLDNYMKIHNLDSVKPLSKCSLLPTCTHEQRVRVGVAGSGRELGAAYQKGESHLP